MIRLVLYPALADGLDFEEEKELRWIALELDLDERLLKEALSRRLSRTEMARAASRVPEDHREDLYDLAEQLASRGGLSQAESASLREVADAMGLSSQAGFSAFDVFPTSEERDEAFHQLARRYAMIAGAVGLIPTPIVSDFSILAPLQVYMVSRIAKLYDYPLDVRKFLKMAAGTVGVGYLCAVGARALLDMIPVAGWAVAGAVAFAGTYAIAVLAKHYIEHDGDISGDSMRDIFKTAFHDGKKDFEQVKDDIEERSDELLDELQKIRRKPRP